MENKSMWSQMREIWRHYSELKSQRRAELKGRWYRQYKKRQHLQKQKQKQKHAQQSVTKDSAKPAHVE
jgi:hypothetical protein